MGFKLPERLHYPSVLQGVLPAYGVRCCTCRLHSNQLSDGIDALKSLVAEQVARNEQRQAGKQSVVNKE
jgi:hypothetical protein